jgi:hypothetical protein
MEKLTHGCTRGADRPAARGASYPLHMRNRKFLLEKAHCQECCQHNRGRSSCIHHSCMQNCSCRAVCSSSKMNEQCTASPPWQHLLHQQKQHHVHPTCLSLRRIMLRSCQLFPVALSCVLVPLPSARWHTSHFPRLLCQNAWREVCWPNRLPTSTTTLPAACFTRPCIICLTSWTTLAADLL